MKKESQKQGFVQGAMILMIGTVTVKVVSMLFKIPVSNMLGGTGYSYFTNAYEIFNLLSTIAAAGFSGSGVQNGIGKLCTGKIS